MLYDDFDVRDFRADPDDDNGDDGVYDDMSDAVSDDVSDDSSSDSGIDFASRAAGTTSRLARLAEDAYNMKSDIHPDDYYDVQDYDADLSSAADDTGDLLAAATYAARTAEALASIADYADYVDLDNLLGAFNAADEALAAATAEHRRVELAAVRDGLDEESTAFAQATYDEWLLLEVAREAARDTHAAWVAGTTALQYDA